ncbi:DUF4292 domain-containing protein [Massilibacteroides sp.]|uniref:DUF4292 domain-containing protein n=1 Tax=Massilibacteroides sp. TaxID=2034766 RepID=UPI0026274B8E|nr:DUF4292 domain-containing protein [Massilibacteroides sp.]MDD4514233.1 DUF4292 domain-containing protein [Massilibacteroides sp.]
MMKKTVRNLSYAGILLLLLLSGCKSSQKVGTVGLGTAKAHKEFFDSMKEQAFQYTTLSARMNAEITTTDKTLSSRVDMKMVKDSAFQLSVVPMLGIELFRIEFTLDSVKVLDRLNKRYVAEGYEGMKGSLPVDFNYYNLQALFTNRIFLPGEQDITPEKYNRFKLSQEGVKAIAKTQDVMDLLYTFLADGEEKLLSLHVTDKDERYNLYWDYQDFRLVEKQPFPMLMDVRIVANNKQTGKATFSFSRVEPDVPVNLSFSIPSKYKRVTFAQIVKSLRNSKTD